MLVYTFETKSENVWHITRLSSTNSRKVINSPKQSVFGHTLYSVFEHHITRLTRTLTASYWQSNQHHLLTRQCAVLAVHKHYMQVATFDQRQHFPVVSAPMTHLYLQQHQHVQTHLTQNIMQCTSARSNISQVYSCSGDKAQCTYNGELMLIHHKDVLQLFQRMGRLSRAICQSLLFSFQV